MSWAQTVMKRKRAEHFGKSQIFDDMEETLILQVRFFQIPAESRSANVLKREF